MTHLKRLFLIAFLIFPFQVFANVNLDGQWKLNKQESDNPRQKFEEARKNDSDEQGNSEHRHSYGGGGGFHGGHHGDNNDRMKALEELSIQYKAPEFHVKDKEGKERIYFTDGRETVLEGREGRSLKATAKEENDQIVIQSATRDGGEMSETYYLSPDATKLYVKVRMKPLMLNDAITFVRVYDRNPPQKEN